MANRIFLRCLKRPIKVLYQRKNSVYLSTLVEDKHVSSFKNNRTKSFPSFLYVKSEVSKQIFPSVKPFIDFDYIINNIDSIEKNLHVRKMNLDFIAEEIIASCKDLLSMRNRFLEIEKAKRNLDPKDSDFEKLKNEQFTLKGKLIDYENTVIPTLLQLPNDVMHSEYCDQDVVIKEFLNTTQRSYHKSHMNINNDESSVDISSISPFSCFLKGKPALLEFAIQDYFKCELEKYEYFLISAPDFIKSAIVEACATDPYSKMKTIALETDGKPLGKSGQMLHLCGGSTIKAFVSYFMRMVISLEMLPYKCVTSARKYNRLNLYHNKPNLFNTAQATTVECFAATSEEQCKDTFEALVEQLSQCYCKLNMPFRLKQVKHPSLKLSESLKVDFEVWSSYLNDYVNCGSVRILDDYVSKRLLMMYNDKEEQKYLHVVSGTAVLSHSLVGCIMETLQTSDGNFEIPDVLKPFMLI